MRLWDVWWAPEGRKVATVRAKTARAAVRRTPQGRRFPGECWAELSEREPVSDAAAEDLALEAGRDRDRGLG